MQLILGYSIIYRASKTNRCRVYYVNYLNGRVLQKVIMMNSAIDQLHSWMTHKESEHLEFKEAKAGYDTDKLTQYYCALANEGGGILSSV